MSEETQVETTVSAEAPATETAAPAVAPAPEKPLSVGDALKAASKKLSDEPAKPASKVEEKPVTPVRGTDGKFSKAPETAAVEKSEEQPVKAAEKAAESQAEKPTAPDVRAPQSWKPAARELAAKLPPEFKPLLEEANRRERETSIAIQQHSERAKVGDAFREVLTPYEALFRANGVDPVRGTAQLAQTAWVLNTGAPAQRAQAIAHMVKSFLGTDEQAIQLLAQAIDGAPAAPAQRQAQPVDPDAIAARVEQTILGRISQQRVEKVRMDVEEWGKDREFFQDVRADMADIVEMSARRGKSITREQAYDLAVSMNPEISSVVKQREAAKSAATAQATTQRTETAASSVRNQPGGTSTLAGKNNLSHMDALKQAAADLAGRGRV